MERQDRGDID